MWLKSQYLQQKQSHFGAKTKCAPMGKKAVFCIWQPLFFMPYGVRLTV